MTMSEVATRAWAGIREDTITEITFSQPVEASPDARSYRIAGTLVPREMFVGGAGGKSHIVNVGGGWRLVVLPRDLSSSASVEARAVAEENPGVVFVRAGESPSSDSAMEIWIPASAIDSIVKREETRFIR